MTRTSTGELDPDLMAEGAGLLNIRSVYDVDGVDTANPDIPTLADPRDNRGIDAAGALFAHRQGRLDSG